MNTMERKILVAVDGSVYSYNSLRYLSQLFTDLPEIFVHLLYVVPVGSMALGMEWLDDQDRIFALRPGERRLYSAARRFMQEAVMQLGRRGIAAEQVSTQIVLSRRGVAADIIDEAKNGLYDALLVGRRGLTKVEEIFMGSVSSTVVQSCYGLPVWVVDGKVNSRRFLLPVDTSFNSLKAADHLGFILEGNPYARVSLVHLSAFVGGDTKPDFQGLEELWGRAWCDQYLRGSEAVYAGPEQMLRDRGVPEGQIFREPEGLSFTTHGSIAKMSRQGEYGTVVFGRRAKGGRNSFFKGVSDKVLALANHVAIWVVG